MKLIKSLIERRIAPFLVGYLAAGWLSLQLVDQVVDRDVLPEVVYRVALTLFLCGIPGALIISWFHGAEGRQVSPRAEKWLLSMVGLFAIAMSTLVVRANMAPASGELDLPPEQDPRRIAVLYFDARGEEADFLASGLTESLIDELSGVGAPLHVVSQNGSRQFIDSPLSHTEIGEALEVGTIVDGTVTRSGDQVRVAVRMVDVVTGEAFENTTLERTQAEIFQLQDELAQQVATFLREKVGEELGELELQRGTDVVEAWELVQRAEQEVEDVQEFLQLGDPVEAAQALQRADALLAEAEGADTEWIEPVKRRGWVSYQLSRLSGFEQARVEEWIAQGEGHAARALAMNDSDPDALELDATLRYWRFLLNLADPSEARDLRNEAEVGFRRAVELEPGLASAQTSLSHLLLAKGEVAEAKIAAQRAYDADPFLRNSNLTLWRMFSASWELELTQEARRACEEGLIRFPEDFRFRQCFLQLYTMAGVDVDLDLMWDRVDEFAELSPPQNREFNRKKGEMYAAMALARADRPDSARAVAQRARGGGAIDPVREIDRLEAIVRSWVGDQDEAVQRIQNYLAANPGEENTYRLAIERGSVPWYLEALSRIDRFRSSLGVR